MSPRNSSRRSPVALFLLACLVPGTALAHPGHEFSQNLMAGLQHPLTGLDHVLMVLAIGAWAVLLPVKGRLVIASSLAAFVGAGALAPIGGGALLESAIAVTVIGAGMLLACGKRWSVGKTAALAGVLALIHGFAHGAEGPARSGSYVVGLMLATGVLSLAASFMAALLQERGHWLRAAGVASAATGLVALGG